ncbi:pyruvate dehydrogenase E2 component (dihydrolipoamide acetyltransferase) [Alkalispirochaeta americana]|uniref:Dihydrolipoamide acetyltransferase component of pyruvate dehydrogenase complex n=1 Tax=Alkalispirochaeta americana TaxID=159291 RepID=A0A1N6QX69_9SPIO|nr:dihydrolipoamide acetyltransferase family protein [Alkalispirochaeta americana]SIQ21204.1 pyruvate dehydrogenase E2 component (dihydrolipoamide acetyltransferase) [Alkalispirochaeta americana]
MADTVLLPQQGNSVESVILLQWTKQVGETVEPGDVLCEVETDKTTMEVESTARGTLLKQLFQEGDEVPVKTALALVGEPGEEADTTTPGIAESREPRNPPETASPRAPGTDSARENRAAPAGTLESAASPRAKTRASAEGILLEELRGSGPGGRIIERDVVASIARQDDLFQEDRQQDTPSRTDKIREPEARPDAETPPPVESTLPLQGVRKVIAQRMRESLATTAQFTLQTSADARALLALRSRFKKDGAPLGLDQITINDMILFATTRTLPDYPALNAHLVEGEIRRFNRVDLSFAVDTERGLMVPTIAAAETLSLKDLAERGKDLVRRCLSGKASGEDLAPGTFTITNLGSLGIEAFTPVLNPPQVAILGVNTITVKAVLDEDGQVQHYPHIGLSLTVDHQVVDGAPAARFLQELARRVSRIDLLLAQ